MSNTQNEQNPQNPNRGTARGNLANHGERKFIDELARVDLHRDFEGVGYSTADAGRLVDRVFGGWLLPSLARLGHHASNETRSAAVDRFDRTPSNAVQVPASLFENSTEADQ